MDNERRLLIALVDAYHEISVAGVTYGKNSRESFVASAAFSWEMMQAERYLDSTRKGGGGDDDAWPTPPKH